MTDKVQASDESVGDESSTAQSGQPDVVSREDFRKMQSIKDREIAAAQRETDAMKERLAQMEDQLDRMIQDPAERSALQQKRMQAELEHYRAQARLADQRQNLALRWNVPADVLAEADTPGAMTAAALDYLADQARTAATRVVAKPEETEENTEEPTDRVVLSPGTPPARDQLSNEDIDGQIQQLKTVAQEGGSRGAQARVEILKLEAQRVRRASPRARL